MRPPLHSVAFAALAMLVGVFAIGPLAYGQDAGRSSRGDECVCGPGSGACQHFLRNPKKPTHDPCWCPRCEGGKTHDGKTVPSGWDGICFASKKEELYLKRHAAAWGIVCSDCFQDETECKAPDGPCGACAASRPGAKDYAGRDARKTVMQRLSREERYFKKAKDVRLLYGEHFYLVTDVGPQKVLTSPTNKRRVSGHEWAHLMMERAEYARREFEDHLGGPLIVDKPTGMYAQGQLTEDDHRRAWSYMQLSLAEWREPWVAMLTGLRKRERARDAFATHLGITPDVFDERWRERVLGKRDSLSPERADADSTGAEALGAGEREGLRNEKDPVRLAALVRGLGTVADVETAKLLVDLLERDHALVRETVLVALVEIEDEAVRDAAWQHGLAHRDAIARAYAARLCATRGVAAAIPSLRKQLGDSNWYARAEAARALGGLGDVESVPALTKMVGDSANKAQVASMDALAALGEASEPAVGKIAALLTSSRWQLRVTAAQALGGIGSMEAVDPLIDRMEIAQSLATLDSRSHFNLVSFADSVTEWNDAPVAATKDNVEKATSWLRNRTADGETNYYDALRTVLDLGERPDSSPNFRDTPDTITFLTDGMPTRGVITDSKTLLSWFSNLNRYARVTTHVIAFGDKGLEIEFLRGLAERNFGTFVHVHGRDG